MLSLQTLYTDEAWRSLVHLACDLSASPHIGEELAYAIAGGLSPSTFESFLELLKNGTFFQLQRSVWNLERMAGHIADVIGTDASRREALVVTCSQSENEAAEALVCAVLAATRDGERDMLAFGLRALDKDSHKNGWIPAIEMLRGLFTRHEPLDNAGMYEIYPRSCNTLRQQLFVRAFGTQQSANRAKALLCQVEASRREMGRPSDEPRHPDIDRGLPWNVALSHHL